MKQAGMTLVFAALSRQHIGIDCEETTNGGEKGTSKGLLLQIETT